MAWDLCQGTLQDVIDKTYTLKPVGTTKDILFQIASGLNCLHENNIIHCDLRPVNVWISTPARNSTVDTPKIKITGFKYSQRRIERTREEIEEGISSDVTNPLVDRPDESLCWMEPNALIIPYDHEFDDRSDVFSYGLICGYTASGGVHAYVENTEERIQNMKDENCNLNVYKDLDPCLLDLIVWILDSEWKKANYVSQILNHPYFWSDKKCLDFIISFYNDKLSDKAIRVQYETALEKNSVTVMNGTNWRVHLKKSSPIVEAIVDNKIIGDKMYDLIRFIRNKVPLYITSFLSLSLIVKNDYSFQSEHYGEQKESVKSEWGPKPDQSATIENNYFTFWAKHFPLLLIHIWRVMEPMIPASEDYLKEQFQNE
jgi:serine/threonine protein kinase